MTSTGLPSSSEKHPGRDLLSAFCLGKLSGPGLEALANHLDACPQCAAALEEVGDDGDPLVSELRKPARRSALTVAERRHAATVAASASLVQTTASAEAPTPHSGPRPGPAAAAPRADRLGQYELLEKLGEGGMGQVFKARHLLMNRVVALKVIHERLLNQPSTVQRFHREIQALARLNHPNLVSAQYADQVGDTHFLVMEYVEGKTLSKVVQEQGQLPVKLACKYIRQAALALQHAHEHHMVHRDIKPSNLFVTAGGQVKVLDLGLARLEEQSASGELTGSNHAVGTPDYMAPEQWDDSRSVDIRADLYSLGCTLYHLLAGQPPFGGPEFGSMPRKMKAHLGVPVPPIRDRRPDVPGAVVAILDRLLAKDPARRYRTPAELVAALEPVIAGPDTAPADSGTEAIARPGPRRRRWRALYLAAGVAVLVLAPLGWMLLRHPGPTPSGPIVQTPPAGPAAPVEELRVVSLRVSHYRGDPPTHLGDMGTTSLATRFDDDIRVSAAFNQPAYCYLIAFNANGKEQLCHPAAADEAPAPSGAMDYPKDPSNYFGLNDGVGLQAFVLVASRQPLPPYARWREQQAPAAWQQVRASGVWRFDGHEYESLPRERGQERPRGGVPQALQDLGTFFQGCPGLDALQIVAFPVKPKADDKDP